MSDGRSPRRGAGTRAGRPQEDTDAAEAELTRSEGLSAVQPASDDHLGDAELIVIAHPDTGAVGSRYRLPRQGRVAVGRGAGAEVRLTGSPSVSRHHATLDLGPASAAIEDNGSRNGTYVNGRAISSRIELRSGDLLQLGGVHFKFLRALDVEAAYHLAMLELAWRDGLTGAYNRRFLDEELGRAIATARRHRQPLALVLFDLDHFKRLNDSHGHVVGDQVLQELVALMRGWLRQEQVLARVGGEEFAVLCPVTAAGAAGVLAERLRAAVAAHRMECLGSEEGVTCSFGAAELEPGDRDGADLYRRADQALYGAKGGGRNRVTVAPPSSRG